jgi:hypothetical protein
LTARVDKLGARITEREIFIEIQDGESREDIAARARALSDGRPIMAMPRVCATAEEWLEQCRRDRAARGRPFP